MSVLAKELVQRAVDKYPLGFEYKGRLSEEEINYIALYCDIKTFSLYMDGSACYSIRRNRAKQ